MGKFDGQLDVAMKGLRSGTFTIEQFLALAKTDAMTAEALVRMRLSQECFEATPRSPVDEHWLMQLLQVLWILDGPSGCVTTLKIQPKRPFIERFLADKLSGNSDKLSEEDLDDIAYHWQHNQSIADRAQQIKEGRIVSHINRLLEVPRELNADVVTAKQRVSEYSFNPDLNALLDKVEEGLGSGDPFDHKSLLTHLRTFFERLHAQCAEKLREKKPETTDGTDPTKCQQVIDYLQRKDVLTDKMQALGRALYGVLSNEGVHAIKSEREYVRLCRNMVAEYALVLFFELERRIDA
jgi:hypothetical protein